MTVLLKRMTAGDSGMLLPGPDGTNPLGFLAALGILRLLSSNANTVTKLAWRKSNGTWRPVIFGMGLELADLGNELKAAFSKLDTSAWLLDKKMPFLASRLRQEGLCAVAAAFNQDRERADTIASFGVECCVDDKGNFKDTALRMVRTGDSAGQGLLAYGKRILDSTTSTELQSAISDNWQYQDKQCALRWDPEENRGYALQWDDPSGDAALSVRGANFLALAAMHLLPTAPVNGHVETTGFGLKRSKRSTFTWPIWQHALNLDTVRSVLALSNLQLSVPPVTELAHLGIVCVYRCDRIMTSTYYANFTPAQKVG